MNSDPEKTAVFAFNETPSPQVRRRDGQFAPGTIIAGRYRISSILGSGGMGEVYRADDIKLDQPVALKFLPARLARDPVLLGRLHDEVRLGRQIAHPNVCRIYDIVEAEGAHFVAMEYVDGEDLSRLLRRIGRLAHDKAVDIARGTAAGLMAAHAKGILHRDLKPANVMVDSRGEARIMDFGLALAAGEDDGTISGTPAYMAPEQFEGHPATVQSDLYSLGLVMYELFTGKRAINARTMPERKRDLSSEIATPSSLVRDLDSVVERVILRCLANDPADRPHSARAVIEALPGGDPLAAALAAGETPSPRIIAAAGAEGSLTPRAAWAMLAAAAVLLTLFLFILTDRSYTKYVSMERSPDVLEERATEILQQLGISASGEPLRSFAEQAGYAVWLIEEGGNAKWQRMKNGPAALAYRLEYGVDARQSHVLRRFTNAPGWTTIEVDPHGRLHHLLVAPQDAKPRALDWRPLLASAGLDPSRLRAVAPRDAPVAPFDARAAWTGTYPNDTTPIRIEAAAWQGTPVFFRVTGVWDEKKDPLRSRPFSNPASARFTNVLMILVFGLALLVGWRNLHLRRGDRQGALRVALVVFLLSAFFSLLQTLHLGNVGGLAAFVRDRIGEAMVIAGIAFMAYIAIEPLARRRWPEQLIAWARLLAGRTRDPLVGRHVLIGVVTGLAHAVLASAAFWLSELIHSERSLRLFAPPTDMAQALSRAFFAFDNGVRSGFLEMTALVLFTMLLRKRAVAVALLFLLNFAFFMVAVGVQTALMPLFVVVAALIAFVTVRFGLLAVAVLQGVAFLVQVTAPPFGPDWLVAYGLVPVAIVVVMAVWAFVVSLGGQSPFSGSLLDE
ncbi:MAG TPA: protein kinase [Thermoanaerobaculia bacterium]|nr:protein kinase [Thermoanaerobaculia bacterium]